MPPNRVETADEQCTAVRDSALSGDNIWLGTRAVEVEINHLSGVRASWSKHRIIQFANHDALAGKGSGRL